MLELITIFANVLIPVFALVVIGYLATPRLALDSRTLSRLAFTILTPAFIFQVLRSTSIEPALALRMMLYIVVVHIITAAVGYAVARALNRSPQMVAAYVLIGVFGNVGNFGLPIITFALGENALAAATVYFLAIMISAFVVGVGAANWHRGKRMDAVVAVVKTPALVAVVPALLCNWWQLTVPLMLERTITLLSQALIPLMLITLGVQLYHNGIPRFNRDILYCSAVRLLVAPLLALVLAVPFGITHLERDVGIMQSSMPAAVLTAIIASENDLLPGFVTATILFSTLLSVVTLTIVVWAVVAVP